MASGWRAEHASVWVIKTKLLEQFEQFSHPRPIAWLLDVSSACQLGEKCE